MNANLYLQNTAATISAGRPAPAAGGRLHRETHHD